jgi:hypothetical protein
MRGWRGYFGFCETPEVLIALTRWIRLRLRAARGVSGAGVIRPLFLGEAQTAGQVMDRPKGDE